MSQSVRKWLILSAKIYVQAKIWIILPLNFLENLRKYISAIYWQNHKLHFQPFIKANSFYDFYYCTGRLFGVLELMHHQWNCE